VIVPSRTSGVGGLHEGVEHGVTGLPHPPDELAGMAASGVRLPLFNSVGGTVRRSGSHGSTQFTTVENHGATIRKPRLTRVEPWAC
jgi:hypothetical protein